MSIKHYVGYNRAYNGVVMDYNNIVSSDIISLLKKQLGLPTFWLMGLLGERGLHIIERGTYCCHINILSLFPSLSL